VDTGPGKGGGEVFLQPSARQGFDLLEDRESPRSGLRDQKQIPRREERGIDKGAKSAGGERSTMKKGGELMLGQVEDRKRKKGENWGGEAVRQNDREGAGLVVRGGQM